MRNVLITGVSGMCGSHLADLLLKKGYKVYGTYRRLSTPNFWRLQALGIFDKINLISADMTDLSSLIEAIKVSQPDEIYNLAAQSFVGASFEQPVHSMHVTGLGVTNILEAMRLVKPDARMYQASSSEMYGAECSGSLNEDSPFNPSSPYAAAKLYGYHMTKMYRDAYGMFCTNGILFNNEGPLRGLEFVTRKISNEVAKIHFGLTDELRLGNLDSVRDWGLSSEYCEAMYMMLQHEKPDDWVIATGETHTVREFAEAAFNVVGLDWKKYVKVDDKFKRPLDVGYLKGDASKARDVLGWKPKVAFKELVKIMVEEDLKRWRMWSEGRTFPWDGTNYTSESGIISSKMKLEKI